MYVEMTYQKMGISEGGHGNSLQYSCLKNLMDREAWQAAWDGKDLDKTEATELTLSCSG